MHVGLLEWIDAELLDQVFDEQDTMQRLEHMAPLEGLFEYVHDGVRKIWRLHPLVRHHCANKRRRETPDRYRKIHRRVAQVLARRRETLLAVRHAGEGSDPALVGRILTEAGSVRLWLLEGVDGLVAMDRLVADETIETHASLAMMRCIALSYLGRFEEGAGYSMRRLPAWATAYPAASWTSIGALPKPCSATTDATRWARSLPSWFGKNMVSTPPSHWLKKCCNTPG